MSILVNTQNEQEEKVLRAFLDSLKYNYQSGIGANEEQINATFLDEYNKEVNLADAEISSGDFIKHTDVVTLLKNRRKTL
ncbi:MAG: hypothetical protein REI64_02840 [Pedobacter sp.]|uniref:hypothetical protein n=1 Tax=Pedobacter sp. TaxID=1411316 RepID=UPI00280824DF|nr:hypothetical protein [Pedobacter sp.]MDQ8003707.1 hypothetical protein [Pedobacter sp.]